MQKLSTFLWFDTQAEDAMVFYTSIFKDSKVGSVSRYGDEGQVITASFEINGQDFIALNGGTMYSFTPAISFMIHCETQEEIDHYWGKLTEGGEEVQCGWLKDKFGLSWQVIPNLLGEYLQDKDPEKSSRVMQAMMAMVKLDIEPLKKAYEG